MEPESRINFIPCVRWVKKGVASTTPSNVQLSKEELVKIIKETKEKLGTLSTDETHMEDDQETAAVVEGNGDSFNLENYDQEVDDNTAEVLGIQSLAELENDEADNFSDTDSDKEDDLIKATDNLILVAHVESDASVLEVYVYNEEEESLYVHHDFILPSFPLALEWLNYEPNQPKGNYCAIGYMSPIIEVWDLDVINCIEPAFKLGKLGNARKNKPKVGHTDAVLALAWNRSFDHVIASGSVDQTVLLWDMETQVPNTTIKAFEEKVQCLEWHRLEAQTLLAGGCDKTARVFDCRTPEPHQKWDLQGEAERLSWNPLQPFSFLAGTSDGVIQCFDCRKGELWSVQGHSKEITGLAVSGQCPGLLLTASTDETVKVWDCTNDSVPELVYEKEFGIGNIHCLEICPDSPFVISLGGDKKSNNFSVFDLQNIDTVKHKFESRQLVQLEADGTNANTS